MEKSQNTDICNQVVNTDSTQKEVNNNININTKSNNMVKNKITAESLITENSSNGVASKEVWRIFFASLTEVEKANNNKLLRHIKNGFPINLRQRKLRDKGGKDYYYVDQLLEGNAKTGYKVMIFEGFDLLIERITLEDFDITLFDDLVTELAK